MPKQPKHIEFFDDERNCGNGVIVTLQWGYSFEMLEHEGVRGFDTISEAKYESALKRVYQCECDECKRNILLTNKS